MITCLCNLILTVYCIFNRGAYQATHFPTHFKDIHGDAKVVPPRRIYRRSKLASTKSCDGLFTVRLATRMYKSRFQTIHGRATEHPTLRSPIDRKIREFKEVPRGFTIAENPGRWQGELKDRGTEGFYRVNLRIVIAKDETYTPSVYTRVCRRIFSFHLD